jgi:hypothetical protein
MRVAPGIAKALEFRQQSPSGLATLRPAAFQIRLAVGWRTRLGCHDSAGWEGVQPGPLRDGPPAETGLPDDGDQGVASIYERLDAIEHRLSHTAPYLFDQVAVRRHFRLPARTAGNRWHYLNWIRIRPLGGRSLDGMATAQLLLDALAQVLQQMEAIGDLAGL